MSPFINDTVNKQAYSPRRETEEQLKKIIDDLSSDKSTSLPSNLFNHARRVKFSAVQDEIFFPCPFKQTETISVLKGLGAAFAASLADVQYGEQERDIEITLERSARYLLGSYLFSIDGLTKLDENVKSKLKSMSFLLGVLSVVCKNLLLVLHRHDAPRCPFLVPSFPQVYFYMTRITTI
jgi:hypothetical protein